MATLDPLDQSYEVLEDARFAGVLDRGPKVPDRLCWRSWIIPGALQKSCRIGDMHKQALESRIWPGRRSLASHTEVLRPLGQPEGRAATASGSLSLPPTTSEFVRRRCAECTGCN